MSKSYAERLAAYEKKRKLQSEALSYTEYERRLLLLVEKYKI